MKYTIKPVRDTKKFQPFSVTLTFETHEEYVNFHDNVMVHLNKATSHPFYGHVFHAGRGDIDHEVSGTL